MTHAPNFLPYPFERLRRISRPDAAFESWCARWIGATRVSGGAVRTLLAAVGEIAVKFDGVLGPGAGGTWRDPTTLVFERDTAVGAPAVRAPDDATAGRTHADLGPGAGDVRSGGAAMGGAAMGGHGAMGGGHGAMGGGQGDAMGGGQGEAMGGGHGAMGGGQGEAMGGGHGAMGGGQGEAPRSGPGERTFAASPVGQRKQVPAAASVDPRAHFVGRALDHRRKQVPAAASVDPRGPTFSDPQQLRVTLASTPAGPPLADADAAYCELRVAGVRVPLAGGGLVVRVIAQRLLGGPAELAAPRPLVPTEHAIFALVIATLLEDLGVATAEVVPRLAAEVAIDPAAVVPVGARIVLGAELELAIVAYVPIGLPLRAAPVRRPPAWTRELAFALPVVIGRCALPTSAIAALAPRDIVTLEGARDRATLELWEAGGVVDLELLPPPAAGAGDARGRVVNSTLTGANAEGRATARVASGYRQRDMALPDDAHAELTVTIGTTRLSLAALVELAAGQVISLERPLAGPFDLMVNGKRVGTGELIDVEGELGVRVLTVGG